MTGVVVVAYYVSNDGQVFRFTLDSPTTIRLSNGAIIQDPPPGEMFASEISANKYAHLIKEHGLKEGARRHLDWVHEQARTTDEKDGPK